MKQAPLQALRQDLEAATQYLNEGKYDRLTVQANRMITEAAVWGDEPGWVLLGLVARLAAIDVPRASESGLLAYTQKEALSDLLTGLRSMLDGPVDDQRPWRLLEKFFQDFWTDLRPRLEGKAYSSNPEFVDAVLLWASEIVRESWQLVGRPTGSPFAGVVNEISRVIKAHGANASQLAQYGVLQSLAWYSDFVRWQCLGADKTPDPDGIKRLLGPLVERVLDVLESRNDLAALFPGVSQVSYEILRLWRNDFARYYDMYIQQERGRIELVPAPEKTEPLAKGRRRKKQD